jgi:hypothetical protein
MKKTTEVRVRMFCATPFQFGEILFGALETICESLALKILGIRRIA